MGLFRRGKRRAKKGWMTSREAQDRANPETGMSEFRRRKEAAKRKGKRP